jgi:hypothetical protein
MRTHNRHSVRPILELQTSFRPGRSAGLRLTNSGLGPAAITKTRLTLDGVPVGELDESGVNRVRDTLTAVRPAAVTLGGTQFAVEIHYESRYGGEKFMTALTAVVDPE